MKFSVVIPTRNRLQLLRHAIETVRRQPYADWELIIADNASEQDVRGYVAALADPRIRYFRSERFLPVTDNWNYAIDKATGDYVAMLGDDDGLTPNYFPKIEAFVASFGDPDVIYMDIYQFFHPGVAPWCKEGYVADIRNGFFFENRHEPFFLAKELVLKAVRGSIHLRRNFTFNIQAFAFKRHFLAHLRARGPIFRSPFPDYYLANVALFMAQVVLVVPEPMAIAGVTDESFGFTLFNELEEQGAALLNTNLENDAMFSGMGPFILPGPVYNTNYLITMAHVVDMLRDDLRDNVAVGRYRRLQIYTCMQRRGWRRWRRTDIGRIIWRRLTLAEKLWTLALTVSLECAKAFRARDRFKKFMWRMLKPYSYEPRVDVQNRGEYHSTLELFEALEAGRINGHVTSGRQRMESPVGKVGHGAN